MFYKTIDGGWRRKFIHPLLFIKKSDFKKLVPILKEKFSNVKKIDNHLKKISGFYDMFENELIGIEFMNSNDVGKFYDIVKELDKKKIVHYGVNLFRYKIILDPNIEFDFKERRYWFFDIEVDNFSDNSSGQEDQISNTVQRQINPIISITIYDSLDDKYYQFVVDPFGKREEYQKVDNNKYVMLFKTEKDLLVQFIKVFKIKQPNVLSGWYSEGYDIPYIVNRLNFLFGEKEHLTLIKGVIPKSRQVKKQDTVVFYNTIGGVETIDYMDVYKKFSMKNPPSYGLDKIQEFEGMSGKTETKGFLNYRTNFQKFMDYIFRDVEILVELEKKNKFLQMMFNLQELVKIPLNSLLMNSKTSEQMFYHQLFKEGKILQSSTNHLDESDTSYQGQIVLTPEDRTYNDVLVFDFQSLYPNSIITFNISPETMVVGEENIKKLDQRNIPYVDFNKIFDFVGIKVKERIVFRLDKEGILPKTIKMLISERLRYKKIYKEQKEGTSEKIEYNLKQWNYKIIINSLYGYLGYKFSPLFNINQQVSVTGSQRYIFLSQKEILEQHPEYNINVIYGDTDSEFVKIYDKETNEEIRINSKEELNELQEKISSYINEKLNEYIHKVCKYVSLEQIKQRNTEQIELDKFFKRVRFFGVKKRYYGYDLEGNELYHGIELVRSDTPNSIKDMLSELFRKQLDGTITKDDLIQVYEKIKEFDLLDVGTPKSVTQLNFSNYKVIPQHVRGIIFQKKIGVSLGDLITDKIYVIPVIVKSGNDVFNIQKEIFNFTRKKSTEEKCVISITQDKVDELKNLIETNYSDVLEVDYFTFFEKNILEKLKQFSELENMINDVRDKLMVKNVLNNKLSLFNIV